ncbi:LysE family translocator [Corynebacterium renale]|uniref:Threonine efflux protein n=1 Tax=Corynebacterium renale TaxID=1724 RepID=A0A2A9DPD2_9CORY|nr:LysE family translocator [Corynebacterium renale]PFG28241.1 threonine efflux protein [Corynebacterium renale]SQI19644.1 arginine exporter [Corynebacterium renale]
MTPSALLSVAALNLVGVASPGPDVMLIIRTATRSRVHAVAASLGIHIGVLMWEILTVAGAAALFTVYPQLIGFVEVFGGLFILYMGYSMLRSGWKNRHTPLGEGDDVTSVLGTPAKAFRTGLFTNLANPKIVLFLTAIVAPVLPASPSLGQTAIIVAALFFPSLLYFLLISVLLSAKVVRQRVLGYGSWIDVGAGVFFLVMGVVLLVRGVGEFF